MLVSIYLSPWRVGDKVHAVEEDALVCMPNIPLGHVVKREEANEPTCPQCRAILARRKEHA